MPNPREVLQRFRFAGAPGAAAAGVPADPQARLAAELEPVLKALDDAQEQAARIRAAARQQADDLRADAGEDAERRRASARASIEGWHRAAAAEAVRASVEEQLSAQAVAGNEAQAVRERAARRMSDYVDRVVAMTLSSAGDDAP